MKLRLTLFALVLLLPVLLLQQPASAAVASQEPTALSISPAIQDRVMAPTEKTAQFEVTIINNTASPQIVAITATDFTALNQSGGVAFLGEDSNRTFTGHGLSSVLTPDRSRLTIAAKSSQVVTVTANDIPKLAPGGHYAAIIVKVVDTTKQRKSNQLANIQAVSSLVFLETAGQGTKTMNLVSLPNQGVSFGLPTETNLVFKATGNTQTIPRGIVTVSRGDNEVMRGIINQNSSLILPGSTRLLQTPLTGTNHPWASGMYTLRAQYKYDGSLGITTFEQRFLYINLVSSLLALVAIVVLLFVILKTRRFWLSIPRKLYRVLRGRALWNMATALVTSSMQTIASDMKKLQKPKYEYLPPPERSGARKKQVKKQ